MRKLPKGKKKTAQANKEIIGILKNLLLDKKKQVPPPKKILLNSSQKSFSFGPLTKFGAKKVFNFWN